MDGCPLTYNLLRDALSQVVATSEELNRITIGFDNGETGVLLRRLWHSWDAAQHFLDFVLADALEDLNAISQNKPWKLFTRKALDGIVSGIQNTQPDSSGDSPTGRSCEIPNCPIPKGWINELKGHLADFEVIRHERYRVLDDKVRRNWWFFYAQKPTAQAALRGNLLYENADSTIRILEREQEFVAFDLIHGLTEAEMDRICDVLMIGSTEDTHAIDGMPLFPSICDVYAEDDGEVQRDASRCESLRQELNTPLHPEMVNVLRHRVRELVSFLRRNDEQSQEPAPATNLPSGSDQPTQATADDLQSDLVTLLQAAAICNRSKRTLERLTGKRGFPRPEVLGGGGKPHEYAWTELRPFLEREYGRTLPETFPAHRLRPVE
jgi:hypothetical protein